MFKDFFRSNSRNSSEAAALKAIKGDFEALLIEPSDVDLANGLEAWGWIGLPRDKPCLVSAFGDVLFDTSKGVLMLDTLEGLLVRLTSNFAELQKDLLSVEAQDRVLSSVWVQAARRRGLILGDGECYDWAVHPALGGHISADSVTKLSFVVKVNLAGQLHRQIKSLPPGTKINRVTISG